MTDNIEHFPLLDSIGVADLDHFDGDFYLLESPHSSYPSKWSGPGTRFHFSLKIDRSRPLLLCLIVFGSVSPHNLSNVFYELDGIVGLTNVVDRGGSFIISFVAPKRLRGGRSIVGYSILEAVSPGGQDSRRLGLSVYRMDVREASSTPVEERAYPATGFRSVRLSSGCANENWHDVLLDIEGFRSFGRDMSLLSVKLFRTEMSCGLELRPDYAGLVIDWELAHTSDHFGKYLRVEVTSDSKWSCKSLIRTISPLGTEDRAIITSLIGSLPALFDRLPPGLVADEVSWRECCTLLADCVGAIEVESGGPSISS